MIDQIETIHVIYLLVFGTGLFALEAIRLLFFAGASYRDTVNRRLTMLQGQPDRESILLQLRRERGLNAGGGFALPLAAVNRLIVQSGLRFGKVRSLLLVMATGGVGAIAAIYAGLPLPFVFGAGVATAIGLPVLVLSMARSRRHRVFGDQFPDAIDVIVRSLKAGHPVPVAVSMVAREMPDPIGTEFGLVSDEITYGSDLESAMRSLQFRVGHSDLHLFVTAISIQASTGGNLREILGNLSRVIRERIKMRRKVKAVSSEGRNAAMILSGLPIFFFAIIQILVPNFYGELWHEPAIRYGLAGAAIWMVLGIAIMAKMIKFKI